MHRYVLVQTIQHGEPWWNDCGVYARTGAYSRILDRFRSWSLILSNRGWMREPTVTLIETDRDIGPDLERWRTMVEYSNLLAWEEIPPSSKEA
jgi:hypothetical protein